MTAATSATNAINGINALVSDGARNIVFAVGDVSKLPEATGIPNALVGSAYSQTCNNLMQIALASVADSGVRVEYVDTRLLGTLIQIPRATGSPTPARALWPASAIPHCRTNSCFMSTEST